MLSGAYSDRYKALQRQQLESFKEAVYQQNQEDIVTRTRKLSVETNKRRKALEQRRKNEREKEEQRRKEILEQRKKQQSEATEKFQRGNKTARTVIGERLRGGGRIHMVHSPNRLDDEFKALGSRTNSYQDSGRLYSPRNVISATSDQLTHTTGGYATVSGRNYGGPGKSHYDSQKLNNTFSDPRSAVNQYISDSRPSYEYNSPYTNKHDSSLKSYSKLNDNSLQNLTNSKSLFEEKLELQKKWLLEQQQKSLYDFQAELATPVNGQLQLNAGQEDDHSISSVDSLEVHHDGTENDPDSAADPNDAKDKKNTNTVNNENRLFVNKLASWASGNGFEDKNDITVDDASDRVQESLAQPQSKKLEKSRPGGTGESVIRTNVKPTTTESSAKQQNESKVNHDSNANVVHYGSGYSNTGTSLKSDSNVPSQHNKQVTQSVLNTSYTINRETQPRPQSQPQPQREQPQRDSRFKEDIASISKYHDYTTSDSAATVAAGQNQNTSNRYRSSTFQVHNKAWETPSPDITEQSEVKVSNTDVKQTVTAHHTIITPSKKTNRPLSAKTTSTAITSQYSSTSDEVYNTHGKTDLADKPLRNEERSVPGSEVKIEVDNDEDSNSETEDDEVGDENSKKKVQIVKSILKKSPSGVYDHLSRTATSSQGKEKPSHGKILNVKDSLEMVKYHLMKDSKEVERKKKSVRWTDIRYEDDVSSITESGEEEIDKIVSNPKPKSTPLKSALKSTPTGSGTSSMPATTKKPPRPVSARVVGSAKVEPPESRVRSAGTVRKGPLMIQPKKAFQPSATNQRTIYDGTENQNVTNGSSRLVYSNVQHGSMVNGHNDVTSDKPNLNRPPVYNANGVRLDRTPTDEEINWLWEKVRTCLNKTDSESSSSSAQPVNESTSQNQAVSTTRNRVVHHQQVDGNQPSQRKITRITSESIRRTNNLSHKRTVSDSVHSSSLLAHRKQAQGQMPNKIGMQTVHQGQRLSDTYNATPSYQGPSMSNSRNQEDVSESMAAFLAGEKLASEHQSVSEQEMQRVMSEAARNQQAINSTRPTQHAPTTLSIEEQRLIQSLERLNERLKIHETNGGLPSKTVHPHPQDSRTDEDDDTVLFIDPPQTQGALDVSKQKSASSGLIHSRHHSHSDTTPHRQIYRGPAAGNQVTSRQYRFY